MLDLLDGYAAGYAMMTCSRDRRGVRYAMARWRRLRKHIAAYQPLRADDECLKRAILDLLDNYAERYRIGVRDAIRDQDR